MKNVSKSRQLTDKQKAELSALEALPDDQIDTSDIPEVRDWSDAKRGLFYRPVKQQITLRLDADVVNWFKEQGLSTKQRRRSKVGQGRLGRRDDRTVR